MVRRARSGHDGAMTTSPPEAPQQGPSAGGPRVSREQITDLGRLRRTRGDRKVAGVAGGLARHLDIDPVILRVAFVVLAFFGGAGIILYAAVWLLVPADGSDDAKVNLDTRSRTIALTLVGAIALLALLGDSLGGWGFPWPLLIIGLIAYLVLSRRNDPGAPSFAPADADSWTPTDGSPPATSPPATSYRGYRPPPPNPRKRGPVLFWFTMALAALSVGVLGIVDLAGADITPSAYPATALGVTALMLLIGAFYGRAGGLILVGLVLAALTAGTTMVERIDFGDVERKPLQVADIDYTYDYDIADIEIDLSRVSDPEELDGRTLNIDVGLGEVTVTVPPGVDVIAEATVDEFGTTRLFGKQRDGSQSATYDSRPSAEEEAPTLTVIVRADIGDITIETSEEDN